jgi:branched-subunit amino acid transport protein
MVFGEVFSRFLKESPVAVMVAALMEHVLAPEKINAIFARNLLRFAVREAESANLRSRSPEAAPCTEAV